MDGVEDRPPRPLLDGRLWPLTASYAFIDAELDEVAGTLVAWREALGKAPRTTQPEGDLEPVLRGLEPMSLGHLELLVPTDSTWTAYFGNGASGADPAPVGVLAERLGRRALFLTWSPARGYESLRFLLFADRPTAFLNHERELQVVRDEDGRRMLHYALGTPQPFEDPEAATRRRIVDRLTPALVERYAAALGLRPFDPGFFRPPAILVESADPRPEVRFTIEGEQARYGFDPSST